MVRHPTPKLLDVDMKPRIQKNKEKGSSKSSMEIVDGIINSILGRSEGVKWYNMHKAPNGYLIDKDGRRVSNASSSLGGQAEDNKETRIQRIIQELNLHLKKKNETSNFLRSG